MADKTERDPGHAVFGLTDDRPQRAAPGEAPPVAPSTAAGAPQYVYLQAPPPAPAAGMGKIVPWLIGLLVVLTGVNLFLVVTARQKLDGVTSKQADQLTLLTKRLDSSDDRYAQLRGQFQVTTEKLGLTQQELSRARTLAAGIQKQQQQAVQQLNQAIAQKASADEMNKLAQESDAKIGGLSTDLAGTKKDLEATKEALTGAKGELSGAIARTHDELVDLAHKTDREYFEFNVRRRSRQKVGNVVIELVKTNPKKNQFTCNLYFDDKRTERKDKAVDEPVYFYMQGAPSALELVVNKLGKDSISGYVSAPKGFIGGTPNVLSSRPGA